MNNNPIYSIIIPHYKTIELLPRAINSIPNDERIEVIVVDNTPDPICIDDYSVFKRSFILLYSSNKRGAGGARNDGMAKATGMWLLFLDADDFFPEGIFQEIFGYANSPHEVVYFQMNAVYSDTLEQADRGHYYFELVDKYLKKEISEDHIRLGFSSPCAKMVSKSLVNRHSIRFDEIIASNDVYFSLLTGYYATSIIAVPMIAYTATVKRGSLTNRRDYPVIKARYLVTLRVNKFLKSHKKSACQKSIMLFFYQSIPLGISVTFEFILLALKFRQSIFIGASRWMNTFIKFLKIEKQNTQYIVK